MEKDASNGKTTAIVAYLTLIGTIIAYFMNLDPKNPFASFHIRQALGIHILYFLLGVLVGGFNNGFIHAGFYIFIAVLWGYGIVSAFQSSTKEIPLLGTYFQKWFRTIG